MTSDADLGGLGYQDALDYVRNIAIALKKYEQDLARLAGQAELWDGRAGLAERGGAPELAVQARQKAAGARGEIARLEAEASRLRADLELLKPKLAVLKASPAADVDRLAAELELLSDSPQALAAAADKKFEDLAVEDALAELKKKTGRD